MAEIYFPENPLSHIRGLIEEIQTLVEFGDLSVRDYNNINSEQFGAPHQASVELLRSLRELPYVWCNLDPFKFEFVGEQIDDTETLHFTQKDRPTEDLQVPVPLELKEILDIGRRLVHPPFSFNALEALSLVSRELESKLEVRESATRRDSHSQVSTEISTLRGSLKDLTDTTTATSPRAVEQPNISIVRYGDGEYNLGGKVSSLEETIEAAEDAVRFEEWFLYHFDPCGGVDQDELSRANDKADIALGSLPFSWCLVSPFEYEFLDVRKDQGGHFCAFRRKENGDEKWVQIPEELADALESYTTNDPHHASYRYSSAVGSLQSLVWQLNIHERSQDNSTLSVEDVSAAKAEEDEEFNWSDVEISFVDNETVSITSPSASGKYGYEGLGFMDKRKGRPDSRWLILAELSTRGSIVLAGDVDQNVKDKAKKAVQDIRKRLRAFFSTDSDPFHKYTSKEGYRPKFSLLDKRPPGATTFRLEDI